MINSVMNTSTNIANYQTDNNKYDKQNTNSNTTTTDSEKSILWKDTFEKSAEPTEAEKEQASLEKLYSYAKNNTTTILTEDQIRSKSEARAKEIFNAIDLIIEYVKTPEGQAKEHEYENALKDEKNAKFYEKSREELSESSKNSQDKAQSLLDNISGVSDSAKQDAMKMINVIFYTSLKDEYQLTTKKNDETLSNNAKSYLNKLRQDNPDTAICITDSNKFSMSGDQIGYHTCIDKNLFELMANNQSHNNIWSKLVNNQYDSFDDVINDINKSGDNALADKFKSNVELHDSKITKNYEF